METRKQSLGSIISYGVEMIMSKTISVLVWIIVAFSVWCFAWFRIWEWVMALAVKHIIWFFVALIMTILVVLYSLGMIGGH